MDPIKEQKEDDFSKKQTSALKNKFYLKLIRNVLNVIMFNISKYFETV